MLPKTSGNKDVTEIIDDLIEAADSIDSEIVNFIHYGYVRERMPLIELESVFKKLSAASRKVSIRVIIFDIDTRFQKEIGITYKDHFFNN